MERATFARVRVPDPPIVVDPADVTPAWLTEVLQAAGHDVQVVSLRHEPVGTGQMAHNERFFLSYDGDAGGAPSTLVGKFPSPDEASRNAGSSGVYRTEVRFYTELAGELAIRVPNCFYGAVSEDSSEFTLLLEDMAPNRQGDQIDGAAPGQIEAALVNLAGLHGPRWGDARLADIEWMAGGLTEIAVPLVQGVTPAFLERFSGRLSKHAQRVLQGFSAGIERWLETMPGPATLVHGDYRLDNLLFATRPGDAPVAAVDWQTLSLGPGGRDTAYLLGNGCAPSVRRACEGRLLEAYAKALARHGIARSAAEVLEDYRHGSFQGPLVTMLGCMAVGRTARGDAMFLAMAERSAAQILDLEALDLIL